MRAAIYVRNINPVALGKQISSIFCYLAEQDFINDYDKELYFEDERNSRNEFTRFMQLLEEEGNVEVLIVASKYYLSIFDDKQTEIEITLKDLGVTLISVEDYYNYIQAMIN